ncbi:STAS domain-containing protein [Rugosimonospora africana]|nr:STAS domain-containing protein [Rugosimonospora africana]
MNQWLLVGGLWEETRDADDGVMCVRLLADLDLATEGAARMRLARLCRDEAVRCLLVMAGPDRFVGLRGLDVLIDASARMRRRGRSLVVVDPPVSLRLMTEALRLGGQLRVIATVRQAMSLADVA